MRERECERGREGERAGERERVTGHGRGRRASDIPADMPQRKAELAGENKLNDVVRGGRLWAAGRVEWAGAGGRGEKAVSRGVKRG